MRGRKRHIVTDTLGLILEVIVHPADVQDRNGAIWLLARLKPLYCWVRTILGDGGYRYKHLAAFCIALGLTLITVHRPKRTYSFGPFTPMPKRWIVERTFGWLGRWRRLSKDYEQLPEVSRAMVQLAMIRTMLQRLTNKPKPSLTHGHF